MSPRLVRHGWALVLAVGVVVFGGLWAAVAFTGNVKQIPTLVLVGACVVPLAFLAFVRGRRMPFSVRGGTLATVALCSGILATGVAGTLEDVVHPLLAPHAFVVVVAVIEETAKLVVPLVVVLRGHRRLLAGDGLLLGVASGAGFAVAETMGFALQTLLATRDDLTDAVGALAVRGLLAPAGHLAWTGLLTAAVVAAVRAGWTPRAAARAAATAVGVVALHAAWDWVAVGDAGDRPSVALGVLGLALAVAVAVVGLGVLGVVVHRLSRSPVNTPGTPGGTVAPGGPVVVAGQG